MIGGMGMKNKNVLFAVLGIIVLVVLVIGVFYHFRDRRTYTLNLPQLEKLESISLNQNEKDISINDREEMKDILYVLNSRSYCSFSIFLLFRIWTNDKLSKKRKLSKRLFE